MYILLIYIALQQVSNNSVTHKRGGCAASYTSAAGDHLSFAIRPSLGQLAMACGSNIYRKCICLIRIYSEYFVRSSILSGSPGGAKGWFWIFGSQTIIFLWLWAGSGLSNSSASKTFVSPLKEKILFSQKIVENVIDIFNHYTAQMAFVAQLCPNIFWCFFCQICHKRADRSHL